MHPLHPRSRTTGTLFTTTLAISFLVVSIPHLLPCPVDRRQFADTITTPDGKIKRRRRRQEEQADEAQLVQEGNGSTTSGDRPKRECPVPKPGGLMGQMMGFEPREKEAPLTVVVESMRERESKAERGREGQDAEA